MYDINDDFLGDPYQRYMAQSPMAATPYLPYDNGQGGAAQAPSLTTPPPSPQSQQAAPPQGIDIGSTLDDASKDIRHWLGPTDVQHKGVFGIHGTMRDILGYLGDALTGHPLYHNTREQEKKSDALNGFQEDPESSIDRMVQVDPNFANQLRQQYATREERDANARTAADRAAAARAQIDARIKDQALQRAAGMISLANRTTLKDGTVDPENYKRVSSAVTNFLASKNITLPEGMTVDDLPGYATSSDKQFTEDYRGEVNDIRWANSDEHIRHNGVTETQGGQRIGETIRHNGVTEGQGATRLDQNGRRIDVQEQHYGNVDRNADIRTGWGPPGKSRRGVAAMKTVSGPDDPVYKALPSGAMYLRPGSSTPYRKK